MTRSIAPPHRRFALAALVLAMSVSAGCTPMVFGTGVAVALRGISERNADEILSDSQLGVAVNITLGEKANDLFPFGLSSGLRSARAPGGGGSQ